MNDRYLYRAKRTDNGDWVEGFLVNKHGLFFIYDIINSDTCRQSNYDVDPSTICQCTGINDKDGKLIWESDVVKDKYVKYRVIWSEEEGSWMLQTVSGAMYGIGSINSEKYVVVGNFFDEGSENIGKGAEEN